MRIKRLIITIWTNSKNLMIPFHKIPIINKIKIIRHSLILLQVSINMLQYETLPQKKSLILIKWDRAVCHSSKKHSKIKHKTQLHSFSCKRNFNKKIRIFKKIKIQIQSWLFSKVHPQTYSKIEEWVQEIQWIIKK